MLKLYRFGPAFGLEDASPFCLKLESYLRIADVKHKVYVQLDPTRAPKGRLPFIRDHDLKLGDSAIIIDYLEQNFPIKIDQELSAKQHAIGRAISLMLEDHFYWALTYSRWVEPQNWSAMKAHFFSHVPFIFRGIISSMVRLKVKRDLYSQGFGRHSAKDIYWLGCQDLESVSEFLGTKRYILGDTVSSYDAVVYGFISSVLECELDSPLKQAALSMDNLHSYCQRMQARYYAETETTTAPDSPLCHA